MVEAMKLVQHGSQTQPDTLKKGFAASTSTQTRALLDTDKIVLALTLGWAHTSYHLNNCGETPT